jgi:hypothetical protein
MTWLCLEHTWYIPHIYHSGMVYIWYLSGMYLVYIWHVSFILVFTRFMLQFYLVVRAEVVGTTPYPLALPHIASVSWYENTLVSNTKFRHLVYDRYIPGIYHLLGPDPNRSGTYWKNRPEADVSLAFIGLVPCVNTNGTFKHQRHWLNTNGIFRFFKFKFWNST